MSQRSLKHRSPAELRRSYPIDDRLNGWYFRREETSSGAWLVEGCNAWGSRVSRRGGDPDVLLQDCIHDAKTLAEQVRAARVEKLLDRLCTDLGFCLPLQERDRIEAQAWVDVAALTDAVFIAEGLDPGTSDRSLYRQVWVQVADALDENLGNDA